ncbi:MAG: Hsp70 family protein [Deltaproteobacteria bacterium]|nr:Hsp70 family protein [Deltaproteobacteria bacterium]
MSHDIVIGIDLGTTNSEAAVVLDGRPELINIDGSPIMPSVVGLSPEGTLLVGQAAANQSLLYPERTIRSIKRQMGQEKTITLGDREFTPVEISAMILRRLKLAAENRLGSEVNRAVITVPAFFSDAQRTATKEAGEIAGFKVERIINEPTAASLCYLAANQADPTRPMMIYDLGGGTFDVSIVQSDGQVTEVLASHGDTHLGGDDFDRLLLAHLVDHFQTIHQVDPLSSLTAKARLIRAAESAKIKLSSEVYTRVSEEHLFESKGLPLHLDLELSLHDYEGLIRHLIDRTKDSIQFALKEAGLLARQLGQVILVGGASRTPLVSQVIFEQTAIMPRFDVDPDLAVAVGASLQAARIAGTYTGQVLVDVTPYSFGTSHLGFLNDLPSKHCYTAVIRRNPPIPTRQTQIFYTTAEGQEKVDVNIYQGENFDARRNLKIGRFMVTGLDTEAPEGSPLVFDMRLTLDGILECHVIEKHTGLKKSITIEDAFRKLSSADVAAARLKIDQAFGVVEEDYDDDLQEELSEFSAELEEDEEPDSERQDIFIIPKAPTDLTEGQRSLWSKAVALLEKTSRLVPELSELDRNEVTEVTGNLCNALDARDFDQAETISDELADILFYLE